MTICSYFMRACLNLMGFAMIRKMLGTVLVLWLFGGAATAQTCGGLVPIQNGATADASQVMTNFNTLLGCINSQVPQRGYLAGLTMSNDVSTSVIDTTVGVATSDDAMALMTLPTTFAKNVSTPWSPGNGSSFGCLDTGNLQASQWYHLYVIARIDSTPAVDELCVWAGSPSPTMPANYTKKRRIGSFKTDGSSHVLAFKQQGDEFIWGAPVVDVSGATIGASSTQFALASVPSGVIVWAKGRTIMGNASNVWYGLLAPNDDTSISAAPGGNENLNGAAGVYTTGDFTLRADTAQHIRASSNVASTIFFWITYGWIDTRGRFN